MCSETEPRFSFSRDLSDDGDQSHPPSPPADENQQQKFRRDTDLLDHCSTAAAADHQFEFSVDSTNDHYPSSTAAADHQFEFSVDSTNDHYPSSTADELFAGGIILPFRETVTSSFSSSSAFVSAAHRRAQSFDKLNLLPPPQKKKPATITTNPPPDAVEDQSSKPSKSFWGFKRSTSLNNYDLKKTLISSLPPLLSRSKSTGSVPVPKKSSQKNEIHHHRKPIPHSAKSSSSSSSSSTSYAYSFPQKPPLKKKNSTARISPVLNVPAISKGTANLFGLGSILIGKEKKSRK
ncbi:hypothetical protein LINPERPRIM_LOCUS12257 [Linum perenne]